MKILRRDDAEYLEKLRFLTAPSSLFDQGIEERARGIIAGVAGQGDDALMEFSRRFDGAELNPQHFRVTQAELFNASLKADEELRSAVKEADKNITAFAKKSLRKNWSSRNSHGATVGEKFDPYQRVGVYIPGGTAPLVSTCLMTISLARVAGCREIVVCTPCGKHGEINAAILFAANFAGATEIYRMGGAHAIAAMALGTRTINRVQKIFGPGNAYVVAAKRLLVGRVGIDLLPGPSEVLVLADETANPKHIAADMIAQAEHGSGFERAWLITTSVKVLNAVEREIRKTVPNYPRYKFIETALNNNGWLIQVKDLDEGIALANEIAPEHCEIMVKQKQKAIDGITTAGGIFVGPYTPTVLGDYVAGPSHTLPTGGAGKAFSGLTVDQFQRRTSVVEYSKSALSSALKSVLKFSEIEGLDAHGDSARIRLAPDRKTAARTKKAIAKPKSAARKK